MSLGAVSDGFLAARTATGDSVAFVELARRYRPLLGRATQDPPPGVEADDLRQEALLGLLATCFAYDRAKGPFPALARVNVCQRVNRARYAARARKHRVLTEAMRDGDEPMRQLAERTPAPDGFDPGRALELRETMRERAKLVRRGRPDRRRRYSDEQIAQALALTAQGKTIKETACAVGASTDRVRRWVDRAGQPRAGRRRFTPTEVRTAVELVHDGASLRQAAATVGTTSPTVLRWVRKAA